MTPKVLVPAACLLSAAASTATGTSFGTISTLGLALLGVGEASGVPAPLMAGAVVSGAYFGDKMSPLSDTTNIAPAVSGTTVYEHVGSMMYTTLPALVLSVVGFSVLGFGAAGEVNPASIEALKSGLQAAFSIGPVTLLPALLVIILSARKVSPLPALSAGIAATALVAAITQKASLQALAKAATNGYLGQTGNEMLDKLLTRGGLVLAVMSSCYLTLVASGNQMLAIILPGQAFREAFPDRGLHPRVLSRTLEDAGTLGAPLVPWSTAALFIQGMLRVPANIYWKFALLNWLTPAIAAIYALTDTFLFRPEASDSGRIAEATQGIRGGINNGD